MLLDVSVTHGNTDKTTNRLFSENLLRLAGVFPFVSATLGDASSTGNHSFLGGWRFAREEYAWLKGEDPAEDEWP